MELTVNDACGRTCRIVRCCFTCIFLLRMQTIALEPVQNERHWRSIYESNRHCPAHRRPRPRRDPQGNPPHPANPRGRPAADSIDTVGKVLLCNGRSGETERVELVHNDESGSVDRRYPRGMNHGNESPESIAAQRIRAIFSVSIRLVRVIVIRAFALLKCHWYGI